ncbi:ClpXP protease specificity-enhancing factor [Basfia succiniciproducens]|uniref:Stringent starvation protein B n=1 Tax=Basfia succiniciproducens TaxID=653940 RepID=A0A1G5AGX0_9PAST|nr:ClpXP protease specificity-enhancing factor [Basfia succiniciproducens]QIM69839.1 ClpXP protease specificity-enhancing factor [Basfia succiniciproducens]SCX77134.1 stringent starvation protein B [Basfia succiniciproducens]SEQ34147.1 stringent starvation protein B [Basfia succiniciproducens]
MEYKSSPKRPYLLRAYYDWLVDNEFTPYLVVDATYYGVDVPQEYVRDGQIVLNLSSGAVANLQLTNDAVMFNARFQGVPREIYIPLGAALAIYARENGDGVMFEPEPIYDELDKKPAELTHDQPLGFTDVVDNAKKEAKTTKTANKKTKDKKSASHLRIVK